MYLENKHIFGISQEIFLGISDWNRRGISNLHPTRMLRFLTDSNWDSNSSVLLSTLCGLMVVQKMRRPSC